MLESWPLCNLDKVRLKSLDLQLSGLFPTKAPQMTQCSSDVTVFNPNSLPDRSVPNPQPWKFLIWQSQKLLNRHRFGFFFFFFFQILDTWLLEPLSRLSSVTRICILAYPRWMKLFWFCLFTQQQERTFSCLSFWALAKICWSSQSEPELIRITGLFNLNSGFRSQLLEGVDAYLPARNCLLILETFVRCRVEKLQLSFPKRVLHTRG